LAGEKNVLQIAKLFYKINNPPTHHQAITVSIFGGLAGNGLKSNALLMD
jgi:hypothetical protein